MPREDRKSTRLNSSHLRISYAVFCLKKKNNKSEYADDCKCGVCRFGGSETYVCSAGSRPLCSDLRPRSCLFPSSSLFFFFFLKDPATTEIYPFPLPDAFR